MGVISTLGVSPMRRRRAVRPLTLRQKAFIAHYLGDALGNASKAYRKAGYTCASPRQANTGGYRLLKNPRVRAAIITHPAFKQLNAKRDRVQARLQRILSNPEATAGAADVMRAARMLARMSGMSGRTADTSVTLEVPPNA